VTLAKGRVADKMGERRRSRYKLPGPGDPEGGLGPEYFACVVFICSVIICSLYKLAISNRAQVILQLGVFPIFSLSALSGGGGGKKFFPPGQKLAFGSRDGLFLPRCYKVYDSTV
jgi:hypothetical protein